jgi:hypothetical protein
MEVKVLRKDNFVIWILKGLLGFFLFVCSMPCDIIEIGNEELNKRKKIKIKEVR